VVFLSSVPQRIQAYSEPVDMRKYAGSVDERNRFAVKVPRPRA
jgi:hypothetical protein